MKLVDSMCLRTGGSILPHVCRDALPERAKCAPPSGLHLPRDEETDINIDQ